MEGLLKPFENKEYYYRKAEAFLEEHNVAADVDRTKFGAGRTDAIISLKPINVSKKMMIKRLRKQKNVKEEPHTDGVKPTMLYFLVYIPREDINGV